MDMKELSKYIGWFYNREDVGITCISGIQMLNGVNDWDINLLYDELSDNYIIVRIDYFKDNTLNSMSLLMDVCEFIRFIDEESIVNDPSELLKNKIECTHYEIEKTKKLIDMRSSIIKDRLKVIQFKKENENETTD